MLSADYRPDYHTTALTAGAKCGVVHRLQPESLSGLHYCFRTVSWTKKSEALMMQGPHVKANRKRTKGPAKANRKGINQVDQLSGDSYLPSLLWFPSGFSFYHESFSDQVHGVFYDF